MQFHQGSPCGAEPGPSMWDGFAASLSRVLLLLPFLPSSPPCIFCAIVSCLVSVLESDEVGKNE